MKRLILASTDNYQNLLEYISRRFDCNGPRYRGGPWPGYNPAKVNEAEFADNLRCKYTECEIVGDHLEIVWLTQEPFTDEEVQDLVREIERSVDFIYEQYMDGEEEDLPYPHIDVKIQCRDGSAYGRYDFSFGG